MSNGNRTVTEVKQRRGTALTDVRSGIEGLDVNEVAMAASWSMELIQRQAPSKFVDSKVCCPAHERALGRVGTGKRTRSIDGGATLLEHSDATEKTPSRIC
jgi:hypothetical protein